jgi:integrase
MGDIDKRRGKFVARWREPDGRQRSKSFDRAGDARHFLTDTEASLNRGVYIDHAAGKLTLTEYSVIWLAGLTFDPVTRMGTETKWRVRILPALGDVPLARLRTSAVQQFVAGLQRDRLSAGYIGTIVTALSAALNAAVKDRLIPSSPAAGMALPRVAERRVTPWDAGRVAAVRAALPEAYRAMVDCGTGLGLRQGEVFGLAVEDIDWPRCTVVHVRRQVRIVGGQLVFSLPKGMKERHVPLPRSVSLRLAEHLGNRGEVSPVTLPWVEPGGKLVTARLIFSTPAGSAVNRNTFNNRWRDALKAAGVPAGGRTACTPCGTTSPASRSPTGCPSATWPITWVTRTST